jgi:hypothetical protein
MIHADISPKSECCCITGTLDVTFVSIIDRLIGKLTIGADFIDHLQGCIATPHQYMSVLVIISKQG